MSKTSSAVKERYNKKAYDKISFRLPKGKKEWLVQKAKEMGYSSVNAFITDAVTQFEK